MIESTRNAATVLFSVYRKKNRRGGVGSSRDFGSSRGVVPLLHCYSTVVLLLVA